MLSKSTATSPLERAGERLPADETLISAKLPIPIIEYVRDYQHNQAITTGNVLFSFKDALTSIIAEHKEKHPNIPQRPTAVKDAEKKRGRKKGKR